jgi:predicted oxidoreductase
VEPGSEKALDLPAAARALEAGADDLVLDDDEGRHRVDPKALDEVGALLLVDAVELERAVVPAALEHLREEPFGTTAGAGNGRIEEHQPRLGVRCRS